MQSTSVRCSKGFLCAAVFAAAMSLVGSTTNANTMNIAGSGTGTIGYTTDPTMNGTENDHAGSNSNINDNNTGTHVDDYPFTTNDYVGVTFSTPEYGVQSVGLTMAMFVDGGWFGPSNTTPGAGNPLTPADLTTPTLQITTDGTHWFNMPTTSDYATVMNGAGIGGGANPNPNNSPLSTFTLSTPFNDVLGVRLLGNGGGVAGFGGFIGVSELAVNAVPEPSTLVLGGLRLVSLLAAAPSSPILNRRRISLAAFLPGKLSPSETVPRETDSDGEPGNRVSQSTLASGPTTALAHRDGAIF